MLNTTFFGCTRLHKGMPDACTLPSHGAFAPAADAVAAGAAGLADEGEVDGTELGGLTGAVVVVAVGVAVVVCAGVAVALDGCGVVGVGHWHGHVGVGCGVAAGVGLADGRAGCVGCWAALVKSNVE